MKTMHLILGCVERRLNSLIEATVLDVCYNRAAVHCTKLARLGDFVKHAGYGGVDLMVLAADNLLPEPGVSEANSEVLIQAIWTARNQCSAPLLVFGVPPDAEYQVREAGADAVLQTPLKTAELRAELNRLLALPKPETANRQNSWPFAGLFGIGSRR